MWGVTPHLQALGVVIGGYIEFISIVKVKKISEKKIGQYVQAVNLAIH